MCCLYHTSLASIYGFVFDLSLATQYKHLRCVSLGSWKLYWNFTGLFMCFFVINSRIWNQTVSLSSCFAISIRTCLQCSTTRFFQNSWSTLLCGKSKCLPDVYIFGLRCLYHGTAKHGLIGRLRLLLLEEAAVTQGEGESYEFFSSSVPLETRPAGPTHPSPTLSPLPDSLPMVGALAEPHG